MRVAEARGETRALKMAVGLYVLVFGLKLVVYLATGVVVILAEALHSLSDVLISSFLLAASIWSRKEADEVHMFGYGRAQNVAALVAATLFISLTSFKVFEEAIPRLFRAGESSYQHLPLALGVIIVSMALAALPLVGLFREENRGAAAKAQLLELVNDELGLLAALVGTLFIAFGLPIADPIAAMAVATIIAVNAVGLLRENLSVLLGRSPGPEVLGKVERLARSVEGVLGVHELRAEYIGPDTVRAGLHIEVERGLPIEQADRVAEEVRQRVHQATGCRYCVIHVDPAKPERTPPTVKDAPTPDAVRPPAEGSDVSPPSS
ncbi:MAG TPA: cation diffusion facilitator family transporter [Candidatus Methylomirabilis sp.]|nr:cation diffusion facilitator family transporter [Candidatus Methylomirabilis sp.]